MFKLYSRIKKLPIFSVNTETKIASFNDFLVNPAQGKIMAILVNEQEFFKNTVKVILIQDVLEWSNAIYIQDPANMADQSELVRLKDTLENYYSLINLKVITQSGDKIGLVSDYIFETTTNRLVRFYVQESKFFSNRRFIIGTNQIHAITKEALIVKDGYEKVSVSEGEEILLQRTFPAAPTMSKNKE